MLPNEAQAHAAVKLAPLPLRQVLEVLDVIDEVHVTPAKLRELARMHCRGESAEGAALRRLVEAVTAGVNDEIFMALLHARLVLRGEV